MKSKFLHALAAFTLFVSSVAPAQAMLKGGTCRGIAENKFICVHLGEVKINEIYEKGFRIVLMYTSRVGDQMLIIEEQKP